MITSYGELLCKIETMNFGAPAVRLSVTNNYMSLEAPAFPDKKTLGDSENWLDRIIAYAVRRRYDSNLNQWKPKHDVLNKIKQHILLDVFTAINSCSKANMPERTSLYKDYKQINIKHNDNPEYYTDVISVLNYYYESRTDSTCKSNVNGLFELLRKKYNGKPS